MTPAEIEESRQNYYKIAGTQPKAESKTTYTRKQMKAAAKKKGANYAGKILNKVAGSNAALADAINQALNDETNPAVKIKVAQRIKKHLSLINNTNKIFAASIEQPTTTVDEPDTKVSTIKGISADLVF